MPVRGQNGTAEQTGLHSISQGLQDAFLELFFRRDTDIPEKRGPSLKSRLQQVETGPVPGRN